MGEHDRERWAKALTTAGWLLVFAYVALLTGQIRSSFAIDDSRFEGGVWGARIERLAFMAFPSNVVLLLAAAGACVAATTFGRDEVDRVEIWLAQLVRVVAGVCFVIIALAVLRILAIVVVGPDSVGDFAALLRQGAGILVALAATRLCLEAERSA